MARAKTLYGGTNFWGESEVQAVLYSEKHLPVLARQLTPSVIREEQSYLSEQVLESLNCHESLDDLPVML